MSDNFLTSGLEIVVVLDLLGLIAYFALALLKPRHRPAGSPSRPSSSVTPYFFWRRPLPATRLGDLTRFLTRPLSSRRKRRSSTGPIARESLETTFGNLRRVLFSYEKGLT